LLVGQSSPDEVPNNVLKTIVKDCGKSDFVMLDPKGYTRSLDQNDQTTPYSSEVTQDLSGITTIKADRQELAALLEVSSHWKQR
jgi:hypothetical protein